MSRVRDIANILSGGSSAIATDAEIPPQVSGKNKVINSDFRLNSLGFSSITSTVSSNNGRMMVDRWQSQVQGSDSAVYSLQQFSGTDTPSDVGKELKNYMRVAVTGSSASGSGTAMYTRIEDSRTLADEIVTVSFWARSSSGTPKIAFDVFRNYGPGGSATDVGIGTSTFTLSTTWTRYTSTFTMSSVSGKTITDGSNWGTAFWFSGASDTTNRTGTVGVQTATIDICAIQLEKGSVATSYSTFTENPQSEIIAAGSNGNFIDNAGNGQYAFGNEGVLVSTNSGATININRWAGYQVAGKNKIINGDFSIWQRGTTFNSIGTSGTYTADRWFVSRRDGSGATVNATRETFSPGSAPVAGYEGQYYLRVQQSVAGTGGLYNVALDQRVEDVRTFAGQTVTLSFWARAASSTTLVVNYEQNFGSGGSNTIYGIGGKVFTIGTSWQRYTMTSDIPSVSGKTIGAGSMLLIPFQPPTNSTYTLDFWGVQLEAGSVATPFTTATGNLQAELAACQRYYYRAGGEFSYPRLNSTTNYPFFGTAIATSSTNAIGVVPLPVPMRVYPTSIDLLSAGSYRLLTGNANYTLSGISLDTTYVFASSTTVSIGMSTSGLTTNNFYYVVGNFVPTAYIGFSAEL